MSTTCVGDRPAPAMGIFERYLTAWVALCIVTGIALGHFLPGLFQAVGGMEVARVNLPVAVLITRAGRSTFRRARSAVTAAGRRTKTR